MHVIIPKYLYEFEVEYHYTSMFSRILTPRLNEQALIWLEDKAYDIPTIQVGGYGSDYSDKHATIVFYHREDMVEFSLQFIGGE
jgi:hypothetical protein